jgi:hypothetical protein
MYWLVVPPSSILSIHEPSDAWWAAPYSESEYVGVVQAASLIHLSSILLSINCTIMLSCFVNNGAVELIE